MTKPRIASSLLPQKYKRAATFAAFCKTHNLNPMDVAELIYLANKATRALLGQTNQREDKLVQQFEAKAKAMGITDITWASAYASFKINGNPALLPKL